MPGHTLKNLIERIRFVANGMGTPDPRLIDSEVLVELVLPRVLHVLTSEIGKDEEGWRSLTSPSSVTITITSGNGDLPDSFDERFTDSFQIITDPTASFNPIYSDYISEGESKFCGAFTFLSRRIYYKEVNTAAAAYSGDIVVKYLSIPQLPSTITSTIQEWPPWFTEQVIAYTAAVITGKIKLEDFSVNEQPGK